MIASESADVLGIEDAYRREASGISWEQISPASDGLDLASDLSQLCSGRVQCRDHLHPAEVRIAIIACAILHGGLIDCRLEHV